MLKFAVMMMLPVLGSAGNINDIIYRTDFINQVKKVLYLAASLDGQTDRMIDRQMLPSLGLALNINDVIYCTDFVNQVITGFIFSNQFSWIEGYDDRQMFNIVLLANISHFVYCNVKNNFVVKLEMLH